MQPRAIVFVLYQHKQMTGNTAWVSLLFNTGLYLWNQNAFSTKRNTYTILFLYITGQGWFTYILTPFPTTVGHTFQVSKWCLGLQWLQCSRQISSDQRACGGIALQLYHHNFSGQGDNISSIDNSLLQPREATLTRLHLRSAPRDKLLQGMMKSS